MACGAGFWPLLLLSCAGGPPVGLRLLPPDPAAELAPGPPRYHLLLEVRAFPPAPPGLEVDGAPVTAAATRLLRVVTDPAQGLPVVVRAEGREWRVVLPVRAGIEPPGQDTPDLLPPLRGTSQVLGSFHSATHVLPGRRHGVDLLPESEDVTVLAPCAAVVVARTTDRPEGGEEGNELHLRRADGLVVVLSHLDRDSAGPAVGVAVAAGQPVGRMGATGHATGPHLHLEVRRHDGDTIPFRLGGRVPARGDRIGRSPGPGH